jgi:hypothetical protein
VMASEASSVSRAKYGLRPIAMPLHHSNGFCHGVSW